ncbi:MAG: TIGR03905 family TSCPD domain-containing protein [Oscillospiraceae bacterium]|nr:TIGR03905 family TSCPD domain-containing protein [Oscillospiraceae bacterium]
MTIKYTYKTQGVCSRQINIDVEDGIVNDISFVAGCNGNLKGIALLAKGRKAEEIIGLLSGLTCESKNTSCPDQLARALSSILEQERRIPDKPDTPE